MEILLDTSFILTCLKEKIDFLEAEEFGNLIVPKQVVLELERLTEKGRLADRENAAIALCILKKKNLKQVELKSKYVDAGIRIYAEKNKNVAVATLDKELQKSLKGRVRILAIRAGERIDWA